MLVTPRRGRVREGGSVICPMTPRRDLSLPEAGRGVARYADRSVCGRSARNVGRHLDAGCVDDRLHILQQRNDIALLGDVRSTAL